MNKLQLYNAAIDFARKTLDQPAGVELDAAIPAQAAELGITGREYEQFKQFFGNQRQTMLNYQTPARAASAKTVPATAPGNQ